VGQSDRPKIGQNKKRLKIHGNWEWKWYFIKNKLIIYSVVVIGSGMEGPKFESLEWKFGAGTSDIRTTDILSQNGTTDIPSLRKIHFL
jgi:hypothetical protein